MSVDAFIDPCPEKMEMREYEWGSFFGVSAHILIASLRSYVHAELHALFFSLYGPYYRAKVIHGYCLAVIIMVVELNFAVSSCCL